MRLNLSWPPSINHYFERNRNGSIRIGKYGLAFREEVILKCRQERIKRLTGRLGVFIVAFPPDKRRRDLDNILKATLDALQHGGVYKDDSQIDALTVHRGPVTPKGALIVTVDDLLRL